MTRIKSSVIAAPVAQPVARLALMIERVCSLFRRPGLADQNLGGVCVTIDKERREADELHQNQIGSKHIIADGCP